MNEKPIPVQIDVAGHHRVEASRGDVVQFNPRLSSEHGGKFGIVRGTTARGHLLVFFPHIVAQDDVVLECEPDHVNYIGRAMFTPRSFHPSAPGERPARRDADSAS